MGGCCATIWSSHEAPRQSQRRLWLHCRGSGSVFLLRECCARAGERANVSAVEGGGGESAQRVAGRRGAITYAGWVCNFGGPSAGSLPARLLSGEVSGEHGSFGWIGGKGERASDGVVYRSGGGQVRISGFALERAARRRSAGSVSGATGHRGNS